MTSAEPLKQTDLERVGAAFTPARMFAVRDLTRAAIHEIAAKCKPGMVEEAAVEMAHEILASHGMVRGWHGVYVRFGTNTTKTFGAPSDPGIVLGADDSFLIDIGPQSMTARWRHSISRRRRFFGCLRFTFVIPPNRLEPSSRICFWVIATSPEALDRIIHESRAITSLRWGVRE